MSKLSNGFEEAIGGKGNQGKYTKQESLGKGKGQTTGDK